MNYKTVIIDDSSVHRLAISFLVQNHPKLQLIGAYSDPYEGIKAIYEHNVDIVFMDILLDDLNAFELLDQIEIPAAIIMNSSWEKFSSKAGQYGLQYFLTKPMQKSDFEAAVKGVLQSLESNKVTRYASS
ncbi:hypothetical protein FGF1_05780 [Flavobacteriaceae bacterium GF1]